MIRIRIRNTVIGFSYFFFFSVVLLIAIDRTSLFLLSYIAVLSHETGHFIAMRMLKTDVYEIDFSLGSVKIVKSGFFKRKTEMIVAAAGPVTNLAFVPLYFIDNSFVKYFALANAVIGVFNMLPIKGLDGGDIAACIFHCSKNKNTILFFLSTATLFCVFLLGVYIFTLSGYNATLIICALYLFILSFFKI